MEDPNILTRNSDSPNVTPTQLLHITDVHLEDKS